MAITSLHPRIRRVLTGSAVGLLTIGLVGLPSASGASQGFIAVTNGMVGVPEVITVSAPSAKGQVVTIGLQSGATAMTMQTTIASNGYGAVNWTPTVTGTYVASGLGAIASIATGTATVAPMPTYTTLLAQNQVQNNVQSELVAAVVAPIGTLAPTGIVTLVGAGGNTPISSAQLAGTLGANIAYANLPWTPPFAGNASLQAIYAGSAGQAGSTSPASSVSVVGTPVTVAVRWPTNLYVGTPTVLQAVTGPGVPAGTAAFSMDNSLYLGGSNPTVNGVASYQWTPPASGTHVLTASFAGGTQLANGLYPVNGSNSQTVTIQPARSADNITVAPPGQATWSIARPIIMTVGANLTLAASSQSGTPVLFSEQGPCVISGSALTALGTGVCQVTAVSPGNAGLAPGTETYTVTVNAPPKRKAKG